MIASAVKNVERIVIGLAIFHVIPANLGLHPVGCMASNVVVVLSARSPTK